MKLWILKPIDENATFEQNGRAVKRWTWDCAWGFVVRADNEKAARKIAANECGDEGDRVWVDDELSSCEELRADGDSGVVFREFLNG